MGDYLVTMAYQKSPTSEIIQNPDIHSVPSSMITKYSHGFLKYFTPLLYSLFCSRASTVKSSGRTTNILTATYIHMYYTFSQNFTF